MSRTLVELSRSVLMSQGESLRSEFANKGYVVLKGVLHDHAEIVELLKGLLDGRKPEEETRDWNVTPSFVLSPISKEVQKVQGVGQYAPSLLDKVFRRKEVQETLMDISRQDAGLDFFGTKFFPMRPGGTSVYCALARLRRLRRLRRRVQLQTHPSLAMASYV